MKKSNLKKYAKLIVCVGANVQKNQEVVISAPVDAAYFVEYVVEECYKRKAKSVTVDWGFTPLTKLAYKYQKVETLKEVPNHVIEKQKHRIETLPAVIHVGGADPDALKGIDQGKMLEVSRHTGAIFKPLREKMENKFQWTIAAIPNEAWAKKIFPELTGKQAVKALWEAIFKCARVEGDPIENWRIHNENFTSKANALKELNIKTLTYKASNGTDLTVSLHQNTHFIGGGTNTLSGVYFNPNLPTEECFTSPDKMSTNGIVYSSKPLSVRGTLVDNFAFVFKDGKVVEVKAQDPAHKVVLESLIATDEGAAYLGEVALVPFNSPINETGLLFYNTLFDENACCHFAIGRGFNNTIDNYDKMTQEEIKAVGLNESLIHVDFMIGTADLDVKATTFDGKEVQIFKNGVWAF